MVGDVYPTGGLGREVRSHDAGMERHRGQSLGVEAPVQLAGEQDVGKLRVAVCPAGRVPPVAVEVVDADVAPHPGGEAGGVEYRRSAGEERVGEQVREQEWREIVDL